MKIAIPVPIKNENAIMDERFGRSVYYALYDDGNNSYEFVTNPALDARGGAGIQAVQFLAIKKVTVVIAPRLGPNAENALKSANIESFKGESISAKELVEKWKNDQLDKFW